MRLGFAAKVLGDGVLPSHDTRRWQSGPHLRVSIERLHAIFDYLDRNDLRWKSPDGPQVQVRSHPSAAAA